MERPLSRPGNAHTGHQPSSSRGSLRPQRSRDFPLYRPERAAQVSLGQRPRKTDHESQSPEGANHGRLLKRGRDSMCTCNAVVPVCRTCGYGPPLQGSGSTRCLPGALPQANLCCPVGAKSTAPMDPCRKPLIRHCGTHFPARKCTHGAINQQERSHAETRRTRRKSKVTAARKISGSLQSQAPSR